MVYRQIRLSGGGGYQAVKYGIGYYYTSRIFLVRAPGLALTN
jgi:hypothetical protein